MNFIEYTAYVTFRLGLCQDLNHMGCINSSLFASSPVPEADVLQSVFLTLNFVHSREYVNERARMCVCLFNGKLIQQ